MKELLEKISNSISNIDNGNVTRDQLDVTIKNLQELEERLIIIRYKIYENERAELNLQLIEGSNVLHENDSIDFQLDLQELSQEEVEFTTSDDKLENNNCSKDIEYNELNDHEKQVFRIIKLVQNNRRIMANDSFGKMFLLNEKLMFINELFDGSSESFASAVRKIDAFSELKEAIAEIARLYLKYHWEIESETVEEFLYKVSCRFA